MNQEKISVFDRVNKKVRIEWIILYMYMRPRSGTIPKDRAPLTDDAHASESLKKVEL